ncbi:MAG: hypothetical protein Q7J08_02605 [Methanocorpusculum sp.]|uniref:hypothetical protein n=1 Tax=Methanocorpusculum sp. TaxID=2058474 RepID=UPI00271D70AE|nr:hypothetical protein [Methanocorpusculum sp.]MDO9522583.1 hypothetical protein [Methanocorpusculum sp.]
MSANELYRVEVRVQNGLKRYYLVREVNTDAKKFAAARMIKSGSKPTKAEITRCIALYGFDLEMKCMNKVAKFRAGKFSFERYADEDEYFELERFRYLLARRPPGDPAQETAAYISDAARIADVVVTPAEVSRLFAAGEIPRGKRLSEINIIQNLKNAYQMREKHAHLTPRMVNTIRDVLTQNLDASPLSDESKKILAELIVSFDQKIKEKAHPFEQCFLLYEAFSAAFPEEGLLGAELFSRTTAGFGYRIPAGTWAETIRWVKKQNADMEIEIRRSFDDLTKGKVGVRQKQLDFFG